MKYMGSKSRIANDILPIILKNRKEGQWYCVPFCGSCSVIEKVDGNRLASDSNGSLISMWIGLQTNDKRPYDIPKSLYDKYRKMYNERTMETWEDLFLVGWIGFMASFNGRFYDGGYSGKHGKRDYISEQIKNTEKQIPNIKGISFIHSTYNEMIFPKNSIIYCDPPYKGTKQYANSKGFDHDYFFEWCRKIKADGNEIFVSEYEAPKDFICVWEKQVTNSMNTTKTYNPTEKLFTL